MRTSKSQMRRIEAIVKADQLIKDKAEILKNPNQCDRQAFQQLKEMDSELHRLNNLIESEKEYDERVGVALEDYDFNAFQEEVDSVIKLSKIVCHFFDENIRLRKALGLIGEQARIPDGEDACLLILKTVRETLEGK